MHAVKVYVIRREGRKSYEAEWKCPHTGRTRRRSLKTKTRREADRLAGRLELELKDEIASGPKVTWDEFRDRYEVEALAGLAEMTAKKVAGVLNSFERSAKLKLISDIDESMVSKYTAKLRNAGRSESTIAGHLRHIKAALRWAADMKLIQSVPKIRMPKSANIIGMKGRPVTTEEFERMLMKTAEIVGEDEAESWKHLLRGLWWSGLRLGESLKLHWCEDTGIVVDLSGRFPMFKIAGHAEKGKKDRLLPMAPEFAQFLEETPEDQRTGYVFNPERQRIRGERPGILTVSRHIAKIGEAASVKVNEKDGEPVYASAHDLRRSFGARWSPRVMPSVLQAMMRHESIVTTMKFYVGHNSNANAAAIWSAVSTIPSTTAETSKTENPATRCEKRGY